MAVLDLGLNGISRVSTYHGPHIGHQFLSKVFTSSLAGRWLEHGPMALWIDNSEMAAVIEVVFIYTRVDLEGIPNTNTKGKKEGREGLYNKQE